MSDGFWLTEAQVERLRPFFQKARGRAQVDERRVLSSIIHFRRMMGVMFRNDQNGGVPGL